MDAIVKHEHHMVVMDRNGHRTVTWDPHDPASINAAKREFDNLIREGYQAFEMDLISENGVVVEGLSDRRMTEFDPQAGKVMMVPHLRGG